MSFFQLEWRKIAPLGACVGMWYWSSSMNALASQTFVKSITEQSADDESILRACCAMVVVTSLQLLAGAVLGTAALATSLYCSEGTIKSLPSLPQLLPDWSGGASTLSSLHTLGSGFTNLGFAYGSASLVQLVKLMEPIQTLVLTVLIARFLPTSNNNTKVTVGIACAVVLVVSGAASILSARPDPPHPWAVAFALLSGFMLASRNVLKKWLQFNKSVTPTASYLPLSQEDRSSHNNNNNAVVVVVPDERHYTPLQKNLLQFVHLSLFGGIVSSAFVAFLVFTPLLPLDDWTTFYRKGTSLSLVGFHATYNMSSLTVLAFLSAPTHSLLNVGKRIINIVVVMIFFHEALGYHEIYGLILSLLGGIWYSVENRKKTKHDEQQQQPHATRNNVLKVFVLLAQLSPLLYSVLSDDDDAA